MKTVTEKIGFMNQNTMKLSDVKYAINNKSIDGNAMRNINSQSE
jgi:hypothetical protein